MRKKGLFSGLSIKKSIVRLDLGYYWAFAALRVFLTLLPQTGYIHPDEYFQTVEVFNGNVFDLEVSPPWEYNVTFPLRSIVLTYSIMQVPLYVLRGIAEFMYLFFQVNVLSSYLILVIPRLVMCLLSFISDYCLYKICYLYGQNYKERLIIFSSSYVCLVYMTRTFNNCIEVLCFNILLLLVATCMAETEKINYQKDYLKTKYDDAPSIPDKIKINKLIKLLPNHSLSRCLAITFITVGGIFNRPTFVCYAIPPLFYWIQRGMGSKQDLYVKEFHSRTLLLALYTLPSVCLFIFIDSAYYGYITYAEIINSKIDFNNFVVTPFNFLKYNINSDNLKEHGLHSRLLHLVVNIPLLFNVLGISGLIITFKMLYRGSCFHWTLLPKPQSITGLMTLSFIFPVVCLSLIPHQEPRFIIPILLPLVFLYSHLIKDFQEHCTSVIPFRKRYPFTTKPSLGLLNLPMKCVNFIKKITENFDNRYNVNGRFLTMLKNAENERDVSKRDTKMKREDAYNESKTNEKKKPVKIQKQPNYLLYLWYIFNIVSVLFFGFVHQGGVYPLAKHVSQELALKQTSTSVHFVTSHIYSFPQHLLFRKNMNREYFPNDNRLKLQKDFYMYEFGSDSTDSICTKLSAILRVSEQRKKQHRSNYNVYYALPISVFENFKHSFANMSELYQYEIVETFSPHLSTEAFPKFTPLDSEFHFNFNSNYFINYFTIFFNNLFKSYYLKDFFGFLMQFRLVLVQIKVK